MVEPSMWIPIANILQRARTCQPTKEFSQQCVTAMIIQQNLWLAAKCQICWSHQACVWTPKIWRLAEATAMMKTEADYITQFSDFLILYQLCLIYSKFDASSAYNLIRASGPLTQFHLCYPFTVFTIADYNQTDSPASVLFRLTALQALKHGSNAVQSYIDLREPLRKGKVSLKLRLPYSRNTCFM